MNTSTTVVVGLALIAGCATRNALQPAPRERVEMKPTEAVAAFVDSLSAAERASAAHSISDPERVNWIFVRGDRPGLFIKDMDAETRRAALVLIDSFLSSAGREQWRLIQVIEAINGANEREAGVKPATFGDDLYSVQVFQPTNAPDSGVWAAQIEGHHFVLNAACVDGVVTVTPAFTGSYPVAISRGPDEGKRPLGPAVTVAFELANALTPAQRTVARIMEGTPADVLFAVGNESSAPDMRGVMRDSMTDAQKTLIDRLLATHAGLLEESIASAQLREWREKHGSQLAFAFVGEADLSKAHYYRLSSPCFTIEYDCTNGDANHVHCVWSDPHTNFGGDALRAHVQSAHAK